MVINYQTLIVTTVKNFIKLFVKNQTNDVAEKTCFSDPKFHIFFGGLSWHLPADAQKVGVAHGSSI